MEGPSQTCRPRGRLTGCHVRPERVWNRSGGDALYLLVCCMTQNLSGSRCIVRAAAIPGVENMTRPNPLVRSRSPIRDSIGVSLACNWKCRCRSISSSVPDSRVVPDNRSRQAERPSARAADPAIGKHRRFRNPTRRYCPVKVPDGDAYSCAGRNPSRPEDRPFRRQADPAHVLGRSQFCSGERGYRASSARRPGEIRAGDAG
jgi:hypothetical protein